MEGRPDWQAAARGRCGHGDAAPAGQKAAGHGAGDRAVLEVTGSPCPRTGGRKGSGDFTVRPPNPTLRFERGRASRSPAALASPRRPHRRRGGHAAPGRPAAAGLDPEGPPRGPGARPGARADRPRADHLRKGRRPANGAAPPAVYHRGSLVLRAAVQDQPGRADPAPRNGRAGRRPPWKCAGTNPRLCWPTSGPAAAAWP